MKISRPPIVAVLGHVDHGKTTLLDRIRKTNVAEREVGGITQHTGAYQVTTQEGKIITFIDTPGHEAFSKMRSRGAQVADIVLLVIAADDGVKPQTRESLAHIRQAGVPFIVVITKIDLPTAQVEQVKKELEKEGVKLEERGGEVVVVPVSAKTGEGIPHLLEMISLLAEVEEVSGSLERPLEAVVIESSFDSKRGPLATVVVRAGKISIGGQIFADGIAGRVRALLDENSKNMDFVLPGSPAQILGFESPPLVGAKVMVSGQEVAMREKQPEVVGEGEDKKLGLIVKADTAGRLEALIACLPDDVRVLQTGIGEVTLGDVMLASSFGATIISLGARFPPEVRRLAEEEKVKIESFEIIYEAMDWVEKALASPQKVEEEKVLGRGEIVAEFPYGVERKIAGVKVIEGRIAKGDKLFLTRGGKPIAQIRIESMKKGRVDAEKVEKGGECGVLFAGKIDFQVGDVIITNKSEARSTKSLPCRQAGETN